MGFGWPSLTATSPWWELREIAVGGFPMSLTFLLGYGSQLVNIFVLGHLGTEAVASATLANLYVNMVSFAPGFGGMAVLDTLGSQAIGAQQPQRVGLVVMRMAVLVGFLTLASAVLLLLAHQVMEALGQDPTVVAMASEFCKMMLVTLIPTQSLELLKRFLNCVGLTLPSTVVSAIGIPVNLCLSLLLIQTDLQYLGSPLANGITQWILAAGLGVYIWRQDRLASEFLSATASKGPKTGLTEAHEGGIELTQRSLPPTVPVIVPVHPVEVSESEADTDDAGSDVDLVEGTQPHGGAETRANPREWMLPVCQCGVNRRECLEVALSDLQGGAELVKAHPVLVSWWPDLRDPSELLRGLWEILVLAAPTALMVMLEWTCFEAQSAIAGMSSVEALAAHSFLATSAAVMFMMPFGISTAAGIRVGYWMGHGSPDKARVAGIVAVLLALVWSAIVTLFLWAFRDPWAGMWGAPASTTRAVAEHLWLVGLFACGDGAQCLLSGVVRGIGMQGHAAWINLLAYLVIGIGTSFALHKEHGLTGVWTGMIIGTVVSSVMMLALLFFFADWKKLSDIAVARAGGETAVAVTVGASDDEEDLTLLSEQLPAMDTRQVSQV
jgi:Na+-driven multidrug efflux pump